MRILKWIIGVTVALFAMALYFTLSTPKHLYTFTGELTDCPSRPSCVSSVATDSTHAIAPLRFRGDATQTLSALARHIATLRDASIEHVKPGYLHAVFVSPKMRYRDDLELLVTGENVIQVRSLSRFGYRDFGVNRERVEALRSWLETEQNKPSWE